MKKFEWAIAIALIALPGFTRAQTDYDMDELARNVPQSFTHSVEDLAGYFKQHIAYDRGRVRAIYAWITLNIRYLDTNNGSEIWATPEHIFRQRPDQVLKNRSAVCQGVANLFQKLAQASDIPCQVIPGIAKNSGREVARTAHAWVAARIQGEWRLFDPTWCLHRPGDGWEVNDRYFMTPPKIFVLDHLPDDPAWQLLENPVTEEIFRENGPEEISALLRQEHEPVFNYRDTLDYWVELDSNARLSNSLYRVLAFNGNNQRIVFGLGQGYWGLFLDLLLQLDSIADRAIIDAAYSIDVSAFSSQLSQLEFYHRQARQLFELLSDERRIAQADKFYTPRDVTAILAHLEGSMWIAAFEDRFDQRSSENTEMFADWLARAELAYARALDNADCRKMSGVCYESYHNLSLAHLQLAERHSTAIRSWINGDGDINRATSIAPLFPAAETLLQKAEIETARLIELPPPYAFEQERMMRVRQVKFNLKMLHLAMRRVQLSSRLEQNLNTAAAPPLPTAQQLDQLEKLSEETQNLALEAEDAIGQLGMDFCTRSMQQLRLEAFALQFNLAGFYLRAAGRQLQTARNNRNLPSERLQIKTGAQTALVQAQQAAATLETLRDSNGLSAENLDEKARQLQQLILSINEFLSQL